MADNLDAVAKLKLIFDGIQELHAAIGELDRARQAGDDIRPAFKKVQDGYTGIRRAAEGASSALKGANTQTDAAAKGWTELDGKIRDVAEAYKVAAREALAAGRAAPNATAFAASNGVSAADLAAVRKGQSANLLADTDPAAALSSLPRLRYALYDVATTAGIVSTAITGIGVASVAAAASMESSFTNVERTLDNVSGEKVQALRQELIGLTREIPQSFANISEIATLGNQLGIQSEDIAKFTEVTAKFSAVTGLTAEASAQAFGSLGQLLHVQSRDYESLGSSIALVGRKSVATEQEIVAMTTRLAASATNAGFTAQQVIALSGAFASLRIAPERAQGVMEVYFKRLNTAISEGGPKLEAFAKITGMTTADVAKLAQTDPTAMFEKLAVSLGKMNQVAQTGALSDLGLDGIRAGEVFGRVSANVDVFDKALRDANQGWSEGTELGNQYAKVVDDLASRWQIFLNALQEGGASLWTALGPVLKVVLDNLTNMIQAFSAFAQSPIGAIVVGLVVSLGALAAAFTGLAAVAALGVASMAAMQTALGELTITGGASVLSLRGISTAITGLATSAGIGTGAIRTLKVALATTGIGLVAVALGTLVAGFIDAANSASQFTAEAKQLGDELNRAIASDTADYYKDSASAVTVYSRAVGDAAPATDDASRAAYDAAGAQGDFADKTQKTTDKISEQIAVLGKHSEALFRQKLAKDPEFEKFASDKDLLDTAKQAGFNVDKMIAQGMAEGGSFTAAVDQLRAKAAALRADWQKATIDGGATAQTDAMYQRVAALEAAIDASDGWAAAQDKGKAAADAAAASNAAAGVVAEDTAGGFTAAGDAASEAADKMWASQQATLDMENSLYQLGSTLGENAGMWDVFSEGGRANLGALYSVLNAIAAQTPGDTASIASNFQALYNALIAGGAATADQLSFLHAKIVELSGGAPVVAANRDFTSLFNGINVGAQKAAKAVGGGSGGLAKKIRTLVDYANDLSGVMKRAFDIRFGGQQGLDDITSGWQKIRDAADQANEAIAEHQRKLSDLAADKQVKQYWLMVAENYGDELRAAKLRSELADITADQAKEQKDLAKEQDKASMTLVGNSEAAIENRSTILGLVGNYQDYLKALAASGMSQKDLQAKSAQLRAEFIQQATSMGYNRGQVEQYAKAFDDMSVAIRRVPRNITVTANANPALQALAEFEAKASSLASRGVNVPITSTYDGSGAAKAARATDLQAQLASWQATYNRGVASGADNVATRALAQIQRISAILNSGNYYTGGYTGDGGMYDIAGAVHKGEFVFSKAATQNLGVNNLSFLHSMAKAGKGFGPVGVGASGVVELSPFDRQLLVDIRNAAGITIGAQTLQANTNGSNQNMGQRRTA